METTTSTREIEMTATKFIVRNHTGRIVGTIAARSMVVAAEQIVAMFPGERVERIDYADTITVNVRGGRFHRIEVAA